MGHKWTFRISAPEEDTPQLTDAVKKLNKALKTLPITAIPDVKIGTPPAWVAGAYITGKQHGKGLSGSGMDARGRDLSGAPKGTPPGKSLMSAEINYDDLSYKNVVTGETSLPAGARYRGRGAYTGMLIVDKVSKYLGSTFEIKVTRASASGKQLTPIPPDMMERQGGTPCGYVHGMIQAIYAAAASGFKGITIEVAVGEKTTKLASCFGCTTFMYAADRPPDAIHLGRAESWSPVEAKNNDWAIEKLDERFLGDAIVDRKPKLKEAVAYLNKKWEAKCALWLHWGTTIDKARVADKHQKAWSELCKFVEKENKESANAFLNALGFSHEPDVLRVGRALKD